MSSACYYFYTYARSVNIFVFVYKVNIWMSTLCANNSIYFWLEDFETENVSNQMELEPLTLESIPNAPPVELPGSVICYPIFWNTGSGGIDIFVYIFNSWNLNCLRVTAFIFDSRTDALEKVSTFFSEKNGLDPDGNWTPNLRIHVRLL